MATDLLPEFRSICVVNGLTGSHEPLLNDGKPVMPRLGPQFIHANVGKWDGGQLKIRFCKHCGVLYLYPERDIDKVEVTG